MAPLLIRLEEQLRQSSDIAERAEINARKACYLARVGEFQSVRNLIADLRADFGGGHNPKISAWIMLSEGILEIFEKMSPQAKDRISRAQLISLAIKDRTLGAITSSWKAHVDFETSDFRSMGKSLRIAIDNADPENDDAQARLAMVVADALYLCGDRAQAQEWFMKSRSHALNAGDQATIDALLYNKAAFSMSWMRSEKCFGAYDESQISLIGQELTSSKNFQSLASIAALSNFVGLCEARVMMLSKDYSKAIDGLLAVRNRGPFASYNFSVDIIDLEIAYCLYQTGQYTAALEKFNVLRNVDYSRFDVDDRLVTSWIKHELSLRDSDFGDSAKYAERLSVDQFEYRSYLMDLRLAIDPIVSNRQ